MGVELHFETIDDWLTSLGQLYQPLEMLFLTVGGDPAIGDELNRFISMISSYTKLGYLVVSKNVLTYEGVSRVRKVMTSKEGKLAVDEIDSQGWEEYNDEIKELRDVKLVQCFLFKILLFMSCRNTFLFFFLLDRFIQNIISIVNVMWFAFIYIL